jgi:hypothetical protein
VGGGAEDMEGRSRLTLLLRKSRYHTAVLSLTLVYIIFFLVCSTARALPDGRAERLHASGARQVSTGIRMTRKKVREVTQGTRGRGDNKRGERSAQTEGGDINRGGATCTSHFYIL